MESQINSFYLVLELLVGQLVNIKNKRGWFGEFS